MECQIAQTNSDKEQIKEYLLQSKTIAVVGASPKEEKASHRVSKYLLEAGYNMIPIYPKEDTILGQKVYRSLKEIKENVDMVVVFRKSDVVDIVADVCIDRGDVKVLWTQIGIINNQASQKAIDAGISVVQNHCAMVEHRELII